MLDYLITACQEATAPLEAAPTIDAVASAAQHIAPAVQAIQVRGGPLPWGRYLLHHDPQDRFNIQLDVFSPGYLGGVHAHGTWGAFFLLRGILQVWDYDLDGDLPRLSRFGVAGPGGLSCFCPPVSDWHRVGTPAQGPQTVSIHIYGRGFDLDVGLALGEDGRPRTYRRGAWGDLDAVRPALGLGA